MPIREYPTMILTTDWNNLVTYLGGPDSASQINTSRIILQTGYPSYNLAQWESSTPGLISGAKIDAVAASKLTGELLGYTDSAPSNPTGTTSTTGVMMGLGVAYTPTRSGIVLVQIEGQMQNNTADDGAQAKLYYGTGSAPANGAALTGTQKGQAAIIDYVPTAAKRWPFGVTTVISGLTLNTAYWFDLALAALTGGTASLTGLEVVICEL